MKQEVAVGNQTKLNIQMKDDTQSLDEVVVVAYGTARKGDLTGALTTMRPDANEAAKAVSIDNLLEGKVAGLVSEHGFFQSGSCFVPYRSWS